MINDHFGKCIECQWNYFPVNKCAGIILKVRQLALIFSESCWRTCTFGLNQVNEFSFVLSLCLSTNFSAYAPQLSWQGSHQEKENCILHKELSSWVFQGSVEGKSLVSLVLVMVEKLWGLWTCFVAFELLWFDSLFAFITISKVRKWSSEISLFYHLRCSERRAKVNILIVPFLKSIFKAVNISTCSYNIKSHKFFLFQNLIPINGSFMLSRAMLDDWHHLQVKTPILAHSSLIILSKFFKLKIYFISFQGIPGFPGNQGLMGQKVSMTESWKIWAWDLFMKRAKWWCLFTWNIFCRIYGRS